MTPCWHHNGAHTLLILLFLLYAVFPFTLCAQTPADSLLVTLYRQDFGGNDPSSPDFPPDGLPEIVGYHYSTSPSPSPNYYALRKSQWGNIGMWHTISDHTFPSDTSRGYALFVDANYVHGIIFRKDLDVPCAGLNMLFSVHVINLDSWNYYQNLLKRGMRLECPNLLFRITDLASGTVLLASPTGSVPFDREDPDPSPEQLPSWLRYSKQLALPAGVTRIRFEIISNTDTGLGADMAIDDISISAVLPAIELPSDTVCLGAPFTFTPHLPASGTFIPPLRWQWERSTDTSSPWNVIASDSLLRIPSASPSDHALYRVKVTGHGGNFLTPGCFSWHEASLTVLNPKDSTLRAHICRGDTCHFNGQTLTEPGDYVYLTKSLLTACDSTVRLHLTVSEPRDTLISARICRGDTCHFNGQTLTDPGDYVYLTKSLLTACDSTVRLHLSVSEPRDTLISAHICHGDLYHFNGQTLTDPGDYTHLTKTLLTACDSTVRLRLSVHPTHDLSLTMPMPQVGFCEWEGDTYRLPGTYTKLLQSAWGCDSLVTLTLQPNPQADILIPEAFSPNGDGTNDRFVIQGLENCPENRIRIFNRWGNKVFEASPYRNDWDGHNREGGNIGSSTELPVGTYYYLLWRHSGATPIKGFIYLNR